MSQEGERGSKSSQKVSHIIRMAPNFLLLNLAVYLIRILGVVDDFIDSLSLYFSCCQLF